METNNLATSDRPEDIKNPSAVVSDIQDNSIIEVMDATLFEKTGRDHNSILSALLNELKPIDFYSTAQLAVGEKIGNKHYLIISVEEVLDTAKRNHWALCLNDGFVYLFNGAYWQQLSKEDIQSFLGKAALALGVESFEAKYFLFRHNLYKQFIALAHLPRPSKPANEVFINLQNGTFLIGSAEQKLRDFNQNDFLTYQLPFEYDSSKQAPIFKQYLNQVLPDTVQQMILAEFIGYVFIKQKTLKLEKSLILYGTGANGKSVFFEIITALLGAQNVSSYSLQSLTNESGYHRARLKDKLLNYASEISPHMDSTIFKQIVSGEPVEARLPYGEPFMLEDYAKLIFNTNELPKEVEHTDAFFRRFIIIHFGVTIPEEERDCELANKIIEQELPAVFNWVLEGLKRLLLQKKFTYSSAVENMVQNYRQQSDSVYLFLDDTRYIIDMEKEKALKLMYMEYKEFCIESGYKACSCKVFSERLRTIGYLVIRKNKGNMVSASKKIVV